MEIPQYTARVVTVDPAQGLVEIVLRGDATSRKAAVYSTPTAFRWPQVGESWTVIQKKGTWYLDAPWPVSSKAQPPITIENNGVILTVNPSNVPGGGTVQITWSGIAVPTPTDWIGIYPAGTVGTGGYADWLYINSGTKTAGTSGLPSGTVTATMPTVPKAYELRLYAANAWTPLYVTGGPVSVHTKTVNDVDPGDAVINSPTGVVHVMGSDDGSTDFSFGNGLPPLGPASGDLSGTYPNPTVQGLRGHPVSATAPTSSQQGLVWSGSSWTPTNVVKQGDAAGGDLSGTYPNPNVAKVAGTPAVQIAKVLVGQSNDVAENWMPPPSGSAATDLTNFTSALTFGGIVVMQAADPSVPYLLPNSAVEIGLGRGLIGQGNPGTTIKATGVSSAITVNGEGPVIGHFQLQGNNIANLPLQIGTVAANFPSQRIFIDTSVDSAVQDCVTILYAQNINWLGGTILNAGRDCLHFDGGTGGHQFWGTEIISDGTSSQRHGVYMSANIVPSPSLGLFDQPSRICFYGGRSEGMYACAVNITNAYGCTFDNFDMNADGNDSSAAIVSIDQISMAPALSSTSHVFRDVGFSGAALAAMFINANCTALLDGECNDYTGLGANVNTGGKLYTMNHTAHSGPAFFAFPSF